MMRLFFCTISHQTVWLSLIWLLTCNNTQKPIPPTLPWPLETPPRVPLITPQPLPIAYKTTKIVLEGIAFEKDTLRLTCSLQSAKGLSVHRSGVSMTVPGQGITKDSIQQYLQKNAFFFLPDPAGFWYQVLGKAGVLPMQYQEDQLSCDLNQQTLTDAQLTMVNIFAWTMDQYQRLFCSSSLTHVPINQNKAPPKNKGDPNKPGHTTPVVKNDPKIWPLEIHHFATNKSDTYTPQMQKIANQYGLKLDGDWNKATIHHLGRHPNAYHLFVLQQMTRAALEAGNDGEQFKKLFTQYVINVVQKNLMLLRKKGWKKTNALPFPPYQPFIPQAA